MKLAVVVRNLPVRRSPPARGRGLKQVRYKLI